MGAIGTMGEQEPAGVRVYSDVCMLRGAGESPVG